jgi:hypothetical protein
MIKILNKIQLLLLHLGPEEIRPQRRVKGVELGRQSLNPSFTDLVQNVARPEIFVNNSRWYRETILPIFLFVRWSLTDKT